ncbi:MAG: hypothetical protein ACI9ON_001155 [Limisphaerales bacterium]|jgi:hypothetical protein
MVKRMPEIANAERRRHKRFDVDGIIVSVRRKGRLAHLIGAAQDFNRHGIGLVIDQPLGKDTLVYLSIRSAYAKIDNIIGIVHNCISQEAGYRCGIQFRTHSPLQHDRREIEKLLGELEQNFDSMNQGRCN